MWNFLDVLRTDLVLFRYQMWGQTQLQSAAWTGTGTDLILSLGTASHVVSILLNLFGVA
eukprot:jgi/Botrbrau1/2634/Bobra.145_1s0052.1